MKITDQDVTYVADLANLELTDQERARMVRDLNSILGYIDRLNKLDTSNVPAMAQTMQAIGGPNGEVSEILRGDELQACLAHRDALTNAPDTDGGFFRVPKVIEK